MSIDPVVRAELGAVRESLIALQRRVVNGLLMSTALACCSALMMYRYAAELDMALLWALNFALCGSSSAQFACLYWKNSRLLRAVNEVLSRHA